MGHSSEWWGSAVPTSPGRIPLPRVPQPGPLAPFPILAFVAPIIAAALMWAFTRSPFVLMFAFLGPVVALATMGDSRRRARLELRQQHAVFEQECVATLDAIDAAHEQERAELDRRVSRSTTLVTSTVRDSERWRVEDGEHLDVRLGTGRLSSSVVLEEDPNVRAHGQSERNKSESLRSRDDLRARASSLNDAAVIVDARWGIGVCGPRSEAAAVATSIGVQLAAALSPVATELSVAFDAAGIFGWARDLPHFALNSAARVSQHNAEPGSAQMSQMLFHPRSGGPAVLLCVAEEENLLPHDCRMVIFVSGSRAHIVRHPDAEFPEHFVPDFISERQARRFAETLMGAARGSFAHWGRVLPEKVALRDFILCESALCESALCESAPAQRSEHALRESHALPQKPSRDALIATVGVGANGPVAIDLVAEGPHTIVGGTTGSGKSEVLVTWVLALAARYDPSEVNFLLVDFKGGAAFTPVQNLPHTVGLLTDLDPSAAHRAILSLRAELRRREQIIADSHVRSIAELPHETDLPRLLIIVDEFAAMATSFPEMHDLFADLAARGRSLGIHLILCTQRPAGTIRDSVLANCTLRVSLRVNNSADSVAVIGTPDAAQIPKHVPGRCLIQRGEAATELVQWAMATEADAREVTARTQGSTSSPRRPWLDPLPAFLEHGAVPHVSLPAVAFGLSDIPEEQRQVAAVYNPVRDGNLFIMGSHRSGKSTLLSTLAASTPDAVVVSSGVEGSWDAITNVLSSVRAGVAPSLVLVDDLDLIVGRFSQEYESAFVDRLTSLLREGPRAGTTLVFTASALRGRVQAISLLCTSALVLRMRDKQDHVLVGGDSADYCAELPSGGGFWRGHRVQVSFSEPLPATVGEASPALTCSPGETLFVVSARPTALRDRLEHLGRVTVLDASRPRLGEIPELGVVSGVKPTIMLGDPDAWLSSTALLGSHRSRGRLVFHDCSLTEFRSIARIREVPPPVDSALDTVVVLHPDGRMHRASLPEL